MEAILKVSNFLEGKGLTISSFAKEIGMKKSSVYNYLSGATTPKTDFWAAIKHSYPEIDLNDYIADVSGFGESHLNEPVSGYDQRRTLQVYVAHASDTIELDHAAGDLFDYLAVHPDDTFPSYDEWHTRLFRVQGESMEPHLQHNDLVLARRLEPDDQLLSGSVYVIVARGLSPSVKRI